MTSAPSMRTEPLQEALADHLFHWGLRPFLSERDYNGWQRDHLRPAELHQLQLLADVRHKDPTDGEADLAFYEYAAQPTIYPTLYSQRFDYYLTVGTAIASRIEPATRILDAGCGLGILTTFYARQFPSITVVGADRSASSLEVARHQASTLGLAHCSFIHLDLSQDRVPDTFDLIIASHSLLQSESDPGLPSDSWQTFQRSPNQPAQQDFEAHTGLGLRLDALCTVLAPQGRLVLCEKARHLGRRIAFQRALAARGLQLVEPPTPIQYLSIEEVTADGPLYVVTRNNPDPGPLVWDEGPDVDQEDCVTTMAGPTAEYIWERLPQREVTHKFSFKPPGMASGSIEWGRAGILSYFYASRHNGFRGLQLARCTEDRVFPSQLGLALQKAKGDAGMIVDALQEAFTSAHVPAAPAEMPLYENHQAAAQAMYEALPDRAVCSQHDQQQPDGKQLHVELGQAGDLVYVYCANTFDQRQLVLIEPSRRSVLEQYYRELTGGVPSDHHASDRDGGPRTGYA